MEHLTFLLKHTDVHQSQWHNKHLGEPGPFQSHPWLQLVDIN